MLSRLSIHNRSPEELQALAQERRKLSTSKAGRLKTLLLSEAKLLEFHADLRIWMDSTTPIRHSAPLKQIDKAAVPCDRPPAAGPLGPGMALSVDDEHALVSVAQPKYFERGDILLAEGERPDNFYMLCSGAVRASRTLEDGRLQIVSVFFPGDGLNPGDILLGRSRTTISTFTPSVVLSISVSQLRSLLAQRPSISRALWRETALQASIQQERLIGLGRKAAEPRLAHALCEFAYRLQRYARDGDAIEFPLTQAELADVLGLSPVHVNRVVQHLRGTGLIDLNRERLIIRNKQMLYKFAEFDPEYLETEPEFQFVGT